MQGRSFQHSDSSSTTSQPVAIVSQAFANAFLANIILWMTAIAVMLAVTGVYGVFSFAINQRTREFGIQMVLGATRRPSSAHFCCVVAVKSRWVC